MEKIVLNATRRTVTGKKVGALRREGKIQRLCMAMVLSHNNHIGAPGNHISPAWC